MKTPACERWLEHNEVIRVKGAWLGSLYPSAQGKSQGDECFHTLVTVKEGDKDAKGGLILSKSSIDPGTSKLFQKFGRSCVGQ